MLEGRGLNARVHMEVSSGVNSVKSSESGQLQAVIIASETLSCGKLQYISQHAKSIKNLWHGVRH